MPATASKPDLLDQSIHVVLTKAQRDQVYKAAAAETMTVSTWARRILLAALKKRDRGE